MEYVKDEGEWNRNLSGDLEIAGELSTYFVGRPVSLDSLSSDKVVVVLCKVVLTLILNSSTNS